MSLSQLRSTADAEVIVNATSGEKICEGYNREMETADPTEHGEVDAMRNCVKKYTDLGWTSEQVSRCSHHPLCEAFHNLPGGPSLSSSVWRALRRPSTACHARRPPYAWPGLTLGLRSVRRR